MEQRSARSQTSAERRPRPSPKEPPFEASDLYRIPLWLAQKPFYALAPISLHFRLAALRGTLDWIFRRHRTALTDTLERSLGATTTARERRRIAHRNLQTLRKAPLAIMWPQIHDFAGVETIPIEGLEHLDKALARQKGAIVVSAYFGYARLLKPILRRRRPDVLLVGNPYAKGAGMNIPLPRLTGVGHLIHTRLLHLPLASLSDRRSKEEMGADLAASFDVRPCVRALERNATLIILADGGRTESRHAVTVAGLKMLFAPGPLSMARSTGAALLPAFVVDEPGTDGPASLRLVICPPLELQVTDDPRRDVEVNLRRFARVFEEHILAYPHDFPWHRWVLHTALDRRSQSRQDASLTTPQEARQP